jgi:PAS domain S-box-containing protein
MNERAAKSATFQARYQSALTGYVGREAQEADLMFALELGKVAIAEGYSLLDLLTTHHTLVSSLIAQSSNLDIQQRLAAANDFLAQAAAPFEMAHRAWHELADRLRLLNVDLEKRVAERTAAHRASEERWRTVFLNAPVGIVTLDLDLRYITANPTFQRMLGYSEDELRSLTAIDIIYADDREATRRLVDETIAGERRSYEVEKRFLRQDGEIIWVNANTSLIPATESFPAFFAGVIVDITDRRRAGEALHQAQAEVARVARLTTMGQLAASIAHEISQPLTAILGSAETCVVWLTKDKPNLLEVREAANRIVKNGHRAGEIMRSIRTLAMKSPAQMDRLSVNSAIRETLVLVAGELRRHNIVLRTVLSSDVGDVWADRVQLQQVVLNLVMNAIEAMRNSASPRALRVRTDLQGRAEILVAVEDSGIGIDAEQADRIFDAFFTTKSEGMGMGLSICRSIIEAHGGRLWVSPNTGRGAIFSLSLPALADATLP